MTAAIGVLGAIAIVALLRSWTRRRDPFAELGTVDRYRRVRDDDARPWKGTT